MRVNLKELNEIKINIETINCKQTFGYMPSYTKVAPIKHRRRKINDYNYNTKKSKLIYYNNEYIHQNNFTIEFIYMAENGTFFLRKFANMGEFFDIIDEELVLYYLNKNNSLF